MTLDACAKALGIGHARNYQRYESGAHSPDAPIIQKIMRLTNGAVTPEDMHADRIDWLKANKPAVFEGVDAVQPIIEAAE
ncbi:helix-turn-helix domain-containing protein [Allorhizobium undicola]|uniref:helix-turn-helix domain-containing protein n=1 Tax=Allorhizobium undicola TaxID=78527 RepID=UPI00048166D5|nr:helix-turn-helix transcriptional regulator [Allorhizobium undicola]